MSLVTQIRKRSIINNDFTMTGTGKSIEISENEMISTETTGHHYSKTSISQILSLCGSG